MGTIEGFQAVEVYREVYGWDIANLDKERPWTRDQQEYVIELYCLGWPLAEMAREMNRTNGYIAGRIWDMHEQGIIREEMWGSKAKDRSKVPKALVEVWA